MKMINKNVRYPCQNCKYFNACGKISRTEPCKGREVADKRRKRRIRR